MISVYDIKRQLLSVVKSRLAESIIIYYFRKYGNTMLNKVSYTLTTKDVKSLMLNFIPIT